jgi:hypothetical protein
MWTEVHIRFGRTCAALVAGLIAAAIPVVVAYARADEGTTASARNNVIAIRPMPVTDDPATAAEHSASMLVVGGLLIGIGSAVRRAA